MPHEGIGLDGFNDLSEAEATAAVLECCSSPQWAAKLVAGRPYETRDALLGKADRILARLPERELLAALESHPRIGDTPETVASAREQSGVSSANPNLLSALDQGNRTYEAKFGYVYLVCASGRPATELLAILMERLDNDAKTEWRVMRSELAKINRIRLDRMLGGST